MSAPTPPPARAPWTERLRAWWPPIAAFLAVLVGVPLLVLAAAFAITGDDDLYTITPTRSCLEDVDGTQVTEREEEIGDVLANSATGGALRARLPNGANLVIISFGEDEQEAERRRRSYLRFAGGTIPVQDLLEQQQNAVLLWERPPTEDDRELVDGCLS